MPVVDLSLMFAVRDLDTGVWVTYSRIPVSTTLVGRPHEPFFGIARDIVHDMPREEFRLSLPEYGLEGEFFS